MDKLTYLLVFLCLSCSSARYGHLTTRTSASKPIAAKEQKIDKGTPTQTALDPTISVLYKKDAKLLVLDHVVHIEPMFGNIPLLEYPRSATKRLIQFTALKESSLSDRSISVDSRIKPAEEHRNHASKGVWILMWSIVIIGTAYAFWLVGGGCAAWIFMAIAMASMLYMMLAN